MSQQYAIFLLKEEVRLYEDALDPEANVTAYPLAEGLAFEGHLYLGPQRTAPPSWVPLMNPHLQRPIERALSAGISAVLLLKYENRIFAFTFGHGKSLLRPFSWVSDFGLKVTLNRIDPSRLRSVDSKFYEELVVSQRKQTSRASDLAAFEVDVARDLVRAVTGEPRDTTFFKRLSGSDSLVVVTDLAFADLGDLCDDLLVAYAEVGYRTSFPWIDYIQEVRDEPLKDTLNELLVAAIQNSETDSMHLAPPEFPDWSEEISFKYTGTPRNISYPDLDLENYLSDHRNDLAELTLDRLKAHQVRVQKGGSNIFERGWSILDCLVWETSLQNIQYALFDGRWFRVDEAYGQRVWDFVNGIPLSQLNLRDAVIGQSEKIYNAQQAQANPGLYALMDTKTFSPQTAATSIEFCDLFDIHGRMIHVKRRSASSTLSHLFSQGSVAGEVFLRDEVFRRQVRSELRRSRKPVQARLIPLTRPIVANFSVIFAMIAKDAAVWPPRLPFFSAVNLMHHVTRIQSLGYPVSLQYIRAR